MLLFLDGRLYLDVLVPTPIILDNLVADGAIPPAIAVFVDSVDRNRDLNCNPAFVEFLADEVIPWLRLQYGPTQSAESTVVAGSSSGGLAAAFAALSRPDAFGRVLSQTGWYPWSPDEDEEPEWLARYVAQILVQPVQFYLEVGRLETEPMSDGGPSQLTANRHFRNLLLARGYSAVYREYNGGHDPICFRGTLGDGLVLLLQQKE